jgi:hypothetical protein
MSRAMSAGGFIRGTSDARRHPRAIAMVFAAAALALVPWVVLLVYLLPSSQRAAHWDVAWAGFDVGMAFLLFAVAVAAWRGSAWLEGAATAAATVLVVDAWFDVLTSSTNAELMTALAEALLVELPMAVLCVLIARSAEHAIAHPGDGRVGVGPSRDRLPFSAR